MCIDEPGMGLNLPHLTTTCLNLKEKNKRVRGIFHVLTEDFIWNIISDGGWFTIKVLFNLFLKWSG